MPRIAAESAALNSQNSSVRVRVTWEVRSRRLLRRANWSHRVQQGAAEDSTTAGQDNRSCMPHPEHAVESGFGPDGVLGPRTGVDGQGFFDSILQRVYAR